MEWLSGGVKVLGFLLRRHYKTALWAVFKQQNCYDEDRPLYLVCVTCEHIPLFSVSSFSSPSHQRTHLHVGRSARLFLGQRRRNVFDLSGGSLTEAEKTVKGICPNCFHRHV